MSIVEPTIVRRDCPATEVPSGQKVTLPAGSRVMITQALGGSYTVMTLEGAMARIDATEADAIGKPAAPKTTYSPDQPFEERFVWEQLRTVYDPEIPVNIVDLGLIYSCEISDVEGGKKVHVRMSLTAPGCGMADVLRQEVQQKVAALPEVRQTEVEVVFDPPWSQARMSDAAKLKLGLL